MITHIRTIHQNKIIHRDIKPDNFLIGHREEDKDKIFLIDFGLGKFYRDANGKHIPYKDSKQLTGTARYASIWTHKGME